MTNQDSNDDDRPSFFTKFFVLIYVSIRSLGSDYKQKIIKALKKLKIALAQESKETKEMLEIYRKHTRGKTTPEEIKKANAQFRDIIKTLGLGVFAFLPFAPITIALIVKIGKHFGIEVLPSSFQNNDKS